MKQLISHPNPKINLGLLIKGRRSDGFHLLETAFIPVFEKDSPKDELILQKTSTAGIKFEMKGLNEDIPNENNLAWKAWKLFSESFPDLPGVNVSLLKNIPAGAGLGGGSADAAFMLLALNEISDFPFSQAQLAVMAKKLGSDVPFFIYNRPMLGTGTGTELSPLEIDFPYTIKLVLSGIHSSTPEAYKGLELDNLDSNRSLTSILKLPVSEWQKNLVNDLETPVFKKYPVLADIKQTLIDEGAIYAAMSGSGSAVFGLFKKEC